MVLNGTGGDELFAGYMRYFPKAIESRYLKLPRFLRRGLVEPLVGQLSPMNAWRLARAEKFTGDPGGYLHDHTTYFPPPVRRLLGNGMEIPDAAQRRLFPAAPHDLQTGMLAADIQTYLREDLLCLLDRTSTAHSVEGRVPLVTWTPSHGSDPSGTAHQEEEWNLFAADWYQDPSFPTFQPHWATV